MAEIVIPGSRVAYSPPPAAHSPSHSLSLVISAGSRVEPAATSWRWYHFLDTTGSKRVVLLPMPPVDVNVDVDVDGGDVDVAAH